MQVLYVYSRVSFKIMMGGGGVIMEYDSRAFSIVIYTAVGIF